MELLRLLASIRTPALNTLFQLITYFGQETVLIMVFCVVYWNINKKLGYKIGLVYFFAGLGAQTLKIAFRIPRPWVIDESFQAVESAVPAATGYSFPSGHTQAATALWGVLGVNSKKRWGKVVCFLLIVLVMISRMYLGVHQPKDVIVAFSISAIAIIFFEKVNVLEAAKRDIWISIIMAVLSVAAISYALVLYNQEVIEYKYAVDCVKAAGAGCGFGLSYYLERKYLKFDIEGTILEKVIRFLVGLGGLVLMKSGLKTLFLPIGLAGDFLRYAIIIFWLIFLFPLLFTKCHSKLKKDNR